MATRAANDSGVEPKPDAPDAAALALRLTDRLSTETDPAAILSLVAETIGRHLRVTRVAYGEIEPGSDHITIPIDWTAGVPSMVGRHPLFRDSPLVRTYLAGAPLAVADVAALDLPHDERALLAATACASFVSVPLIRNGEFVALFSATNDTPRVWAPDEIALMEAIAARTWSALEHVRTLARLRESEEQFRMLAEHMPGICWLSEADSFAYWMNKAGRDYFGVEAGLGDDAMRVVHPDDHASAAALWAKGRSRAEPIEGVVRLRGRDGVYRPFLSRAAPVCDANGAVVRWCGIQVDLSEKRARDAHEAFFRALSEAIREESDTARILATVAATLKTHLGAARVLYSEPEGGEAMTFTVHRDAGPARGQYRVEPGFADIMAAYARGETIVTEDVARVAGLITPQVRDYFLKVGMRSGINVPLVKEGVLVAILSVHHDTPRPWARDEIKLVEEIAERIWSTISRARAEAALLERQRHQAFLIDWSDRIRGETRARAILATTVERLGEHLGCVRASFAESATDGLHFTVVEDWVAASAASPDARTRDSSYSLVELGAAVQATYTAGKVVRFDDTARDPRVTPALAAFYARFGIGSFVTMPLLHGGRLRAILSIADAGPRRWSEGACELVREVADRLWGSVERARAQADLLERERNQAFLIDWSDRLRTEREPAAIVAATLSGLCRHLGADRAYYAIGSEAAGRFTVIDEWRDADVSSRIGQVSTIAEIGEAMVQRLAAGVAVAVDDVASEPSIPVEARPHYAANGTAAFLDVPLIRGGVMRALVAMQQVRQRHWTVAEVTLVQEVCERMWSQLERVRAETALHERERHQAFLLEWSDALRRLQGPDAILAMTLARLRGYLRAARTTYAYGDAAERTFTVAAEDRAGAEVPSLAGTTFSMDQVGATVERDWLSGTNLCYHDVTSDPRIEPAVRRAYAERGTASFVSIPLVVDGRVRAVLSVQHDEPRRWRDSEQQLIRDLAERTWIALDRARAQAAMDRRERDQAFLLAWSDRLRTESEPATIIDVTLTAVAQHLSLDRATYSEIGIDDEEGGEKGGGGDNRYTIRAEWCGAVEPVLGMSYPSSNLSPVVRAAYLAGETLVSRDLSRDERFSAVARAKFAERRVVGRIGVPLSRGGVVRSIIGFDTVEPRAWREEEVQLAREVAERMWVVLERARAEAALKERERAQAFLIDWTDRVRGETGARAILSVTLERLAMHLGTARANYAEADAGGERFAIREEWRRGARAGDPVGLRPRAGVSDGVHHLYLGGETVIVRDVEADARVAAEACAHYLSVEGRAFLGVPLIRDGRVHAVLSVQDARARDWQPGEIQLVRDVADRTWALLERARAETALQERERAQAFLLEWSDRVRDETSARAILGATLDHVGRYLDVARANYGEADDAETGLVVLQEWRRDGGLSVAGRLFPWSALGERLLADHRTGEPVLVHDIATDPRLDPADRAMYASVEVGAVLSVPLVRAGRIEATLTIQQPTARQWTAEEARLMRDLAERTWAVLERRRSEERMADSEALLAAFMDNAPIAMYLKDDAGRYVRLNREMAVVLDSEVPDALGRTTHDFMSPEVAAEVTRLDRLALDGGIHAAELSIGDRDRYASALSVRFAVPAYEGRPRRLGGFVIDLTERKAAEAALERSRETLFQTEKLSALGSLLAGVSHELNNPLSIVVAQAVMMERQAKGSEVAVRAEKIRKAADRCARIVQTFLAMARQKAPERKPVDLNTVVTAALDLTAYGLRAEGVTVERTLTPALPSISADSDQLHQIIVNLVVNAQQAMAGAGLPGRHVLTVSTMLGSEPQTVVVEVTDTGPGVPEEIRRRMFEPFFTTKPQGEGTGVGLSFSQGLAEAHGGRLALMPSDRGARFRLTLPVSADQMLPRAEPELPAPAAGPVRRALVVDDEAEIAEALADFLWLEGYDCDVAVGGAAAKARLAEGQYDLIVSDLRMPDVDGPELYAWLGETRPDLAPRIAFTTGDTLGTAVARFLREVQRPVLEKPFVPEAVRRFLDQMEDR